MRPVLKLWVLPLMGVALPAAGATSRAALAQHAIPAEQIQPSALVMSYTVGTVRNRVDRDDAFAASVQASGQMSMASPDRRAAARAYAFGYNAGYRNGVEDRATKALADPTRYPEYHSALGGYDQTYGSSADYEADYRSAFEDGYNDGYNGRANALVESEQNPGEMQSAQASPQSPAATQPSPAPAAAGTSSEAAPGGAAGAAQTGTPAATPGPPAPATQAGAGATPAATPNPPSGTASAMPPATYNPQSAKKAMAIGYREGYSAGENDSNQNSPYNIETNNEYLSANAGYDTSLAPFPDYQANFRSGFRQGYDDGFRHRLYNSAIGLRITESSQPVAGANPQPNPNWNSDIVHLETGTKLEATLDQAISTKSAQDGQTFTATVSQPLWIGQYAAIPAGSKVHGTVVNTKRGSRLGRSASLTLQFNSLDLLAGAKYPIQGEPVGVDAPKTTTNEGTIKQQGGTSAGKQAGEGGAVGAIIGVITGGGKGALTGGLAGAAIGGAGAIIMHARDINLPAGMTIVFMLDRPLDVKRTD
jgi:hypothetical protein